MRIIIIEDEKPAARRLQRMLEAQHIKTEAMLHSVLEAVTWLKENPHPDLIFLDIQLSDGLSFEIFDQVQVQSSIIFTTAFDAYALQAFKLNSIDYLLKPIEAEELQAAIKKYKKYKAPPVDVALHFEDIKSLLQQNNTFPLFKERFTTKVGQHIKVIPVSEVVCFFSENKGTYLRTYGGRNYLLETKLEQLEEDLNPKNFFRINRKYIIHVSAIEDIIAYTNSRLKIVLKNYNQDDVIVARERVKDFKLWLT
jgi:DNA-binding LytR/AlgR family response regulator